MATLTTEPITEPIRNYTGATLNVGSVASFAHLAQAHQDRLRPAEQRVVEHLLGLDPASEGATAGAIANRLGVSQATVVNAVQRLGYAGFGDFRRRLIAERAVEHAQRLAVDSAAEGATGGANGDPVMAICRRVFDEDLRTLEATGRSLDGSAFHRAVELLAAAPQVLCVGAGWSAVLARLAAGTLTKYGVRALAEELAIEQLALVQVADEQTVLFAISHRGRNEELIEVVERARARGMAVLALTNWAGSALARLADVVLLSVGLALPDGLHPNQSAGPVTYLTVVRALGEAVGWRNERAAPVGLATNLT
jgi:RpiR family carbohydrate utilization transcriptional regulator